MTCTRQKSLRKTGERKNFPTEFTKSISTLLDRIVDNDEIALAPEATQPIMMR